MLVRCQDLNVDIDIRKNGIYPFINCSALGKSLLARELAMLQDSRFNVLIIDELDSPTIIDAKISEFISKKAAYCVIDRYNFLRCDRLDTYMIENRESSIILVDTKDTDNFMPYNKLASVIYDEGKIYIW